MQNLTYTHETMDTYPKYNLTAERILRNGNDTNTQLIVKNDKVVAHFSNRYKVIPNEDVYEIAVKMAKATEMISVVDMPDSWKGPMEHSPYMGNMDDSITALFVKKDEINIGKLDTGKPDLIHGGVGIGSSITGKSGIRAFFFVFRRICGNYAFHTFHESHAIEVTEDLKDIGEINDARVLANKVFIHSKNVDLEKFEKAIEETLMAGEGVIQRYKDMKAEKLLEKHALEIARDFPKKVTKNLNWLSWDDDNKPSLTKEVDQFTAFNDMTEILTHDKDIGYVTKMWAFGKLDRLLVAAQ